MKRLISARLLKKLTLGLIGLYMVGCSAAPSVIKSTRLEPISDMDKRITKNGVTVSVTSVTTPQQALQYPELLSNVTVMKQTLFGPQPKEDKVSVIYPAFKINIRNNTGNSIYLDGVALSLSINGIDYYMMAHSTAVNNVQTKFPGQIDILNKIRSLNYLGKGQKERVFPGKDREFWVAFDGIKEVKEGIGSATLQLYDLVTKTDAAGNPTERTSFDFNFKEVTETVQR